MESLQKAVIAIVAMTFATIIHIQGHSCKNRLQVASRKKGILLD